MKIVVIGGAGFVGMHIARKLATIGHRVTTIDIVSPPTVIGPVVEMEHVHLNVTDGAALKVAICATKPDAVVHAAAITPGDDEIERAEEIIQVNQLSTLSALLAMNQAGGKRFMFLSSAGVYRDPPEGTELVESSALNEFGGLYAQTKIASERLCHWASRELGIAATSLRVGPVYGEFERPSHSRSRMSPLHAAIELALSERAIVCNAPETAYNWIHGDDVGNAVALAIKRPFENPVYNLAGPSCTMSETLETVASQIPGTVVRWTDDRREANLLLPERSRPMSSDLIAKKIGYQPSIDLDAGIAQTVKAIKKSRRD